MARKFRVDFVNQESLNYIPELDSYVGKVLEFNNEAGERDYGVGLYTPDKSNWWYFDRPWVTEVFEEVSLKFKVGDLVRIKEGLQTPLGLAEESIYCVGQLSGMGSLSVVGKAGWFAEKYFELFAQPVKTISIDSDQEHTGGSVNYYKVEVKTPTTFDQPYWAECNDLIEALDMNYAEGNAFKAIWRRCAERQGKKKKGNNTYYDAEKILFFAQRILEQEKEKQ